MSLAGGSLTLEAVEDRNDRASQPDKCPGSQLVANSLARPPASWLVHSVRVGLARLAGQRYSGGGMEAVSERASKRLRSLRFSIEIFQFFNLKLQWG